MIDLLFIAIFQAAAGDPRSAPAATSDVSPPATQTQTSTQGTGQANPAPSAGEQLVCRKIMATGSRIAIRTCRPQSMADNEAR